MDRDSVMDGGKQGQATTEEGAIELVCAWNPRKQSIFKPGHIRAAWRHLERQDWMALVSP